MGSPRSISLLSKRLQRSLLTFFSLVRVYLSTPKGCVKRKNDNVASVGTETDGSSPPKKKNKTGTKRKATNRLAEHWLDGPLVDDYFRISSSLLVYSNLVLAASSTPSRYFSRTAACFTDAQSCASMDSRMFRIVSSILSTVKSVSLHEHNLSSERYHYFLF